jgi:hypothetical protein
MNTELSWLIIIIEQGYLALALPNMSKKQNYIILETRELEVRFCFNTRNPF